MTGEADRPLVRLEVAGGVATITLDSPANRNALSLRLVTELVDALDRATASVADQGTRAIVLTHTRPAFCAGADLKERARTPDAAGPSSALMMRAMRALMDSAVPTIAAVDGPVRAGGIGLMASCDLVVVRSDVVFALTEVRIGVAAAIISVPIFRRASPSRLAAAFLTGEPFDAFAARDAGLITHVTDDVAAAVAALCDGVAMGAPGAVAATKQLLVRAFDHDVAARDAELARMQQLSDDLFAGAEATEGMAAFAERRPPAWQHPRTN